MFLTAENYYSAESNQEFMSVSQFKDFEKCEAQAMAKIRGEFRMEPTTAMLIGSYVDAHFEGTLDLFQAQHPEVISSRGPTAGQLKSEFQKANQIIQRIEADPFFMAHMQGEKQTVFTGELFGCMWKAKTDVYLPKSRIVDLKCMRSMERVMGKSFVDHWMYDVQLAVYQALEYYDRGDDEIGLLPMFLAVATKEDPEDLAVISVPQWRLDECLKYVERQLPRYLEVKAGHVEPERCGCCDYCRGTKVLTETIDYEDVGYSARELRRMKGDY